MKDINAPARTLALTVIVLGGLAASTVITSDPASAATEELVAKPYRTGEEKRVDNPVDVWMLAQSGPGGKAVEGPSRYKLVDGWAGRFEILDTTDSRQGDFSVVFTVKHPGKEKAFGFFSGQYIDRWTLAPEFSLHFWLKAAADGARGPWTLAIYDTAGKRATTTLDQFSANGHWREYTLPLKSLKADEGFTFGAVRSVQIEADLSKGARLWLDDVYFRCGDEHLGVSDKTITQYMAETAATRPRRVAEALAAKGGFEMTRFVCELWQGNRLEDTNHEIIQWIDKAKGSYWSLFAGSTVHWLYFGFSSNGRLKPGRLTPECEKRLLDFYWEHTNLKNDIASARRSTWYVAGSENHDINAKHEDLLSSQIFLHQPEYARRVYPDLGRMIGYQYDMNPEFLGKGGNPVPKLGSGNFKDGKQYTAKDHYDAWVKFWKEFFAERARHGFFIEHNASGYMAHTGRFLHDIYAWSEDEELRRQARMFLDLVWMQWAQDQLLTLNGGAATRGNAGPGRMGPMAQSFMGGPINFMYLFSDYQWPRQVWEMMLDRKGKGEYAFLSRKPNEEQDVWPRPAGNEFSMVIRPIPAWPATVGSRRITSWDCAWTIPAPCIAISLVPGRGSSFPRRRTG